MSGEPGPLLRVATYNVHGCRGMDGQRSESRIADVIASMSADVVGLQELDSGRARSGAIDQAAAIAQQLGWQHFFHPAMRHGDEQYGNAIVSRFPINATRAVELPGSGSWYCREKRAAIGAELQTPLGHVQLINTHLGLGGGERILQARLLLGAEWLGAPANDTARIFLGDLNSVRASRAYRLIGAQMRDVRTLVSPPGAFRTFPTRFPSLAVDHIFINAALQPAKLSVHRTPLSRVASDHFPLVADLLRSNQR